MSWADVAVGMVGVCVMSGPIVCPRRRSDEFWWLKMRLVPRRDLRDMCGLRPAPLRDRWP